MTTKASSALPFTSTVGYSVELMKKMWGIAGLPGMPNPGQMASMVMRLPQQLPSMVARGRRGARGERDLRCAPRLRYPVG